MQSDVPKLYELYKTGQLRLDEMISSRDPMKRINEAVDEVRHGEVLRNVIVFDRQ